MKCLQCGAEFTPRSITQLYCSLKCGKKYRKNTDNKRTYPSVTFKCSWCGKTVVTEEGSRDMRSRFCSHECEKKYWRHPPSDDPRTRTNFRSIEEYASWEKKTNQ